jgi:uncharacterized protein YdhG (YjbR/CyaY superfamily)
VKNEVDDYIAAAPTAAQPHLRRLRKLIKAAAPAAEERISYGMPYYDLHGRLVYYAVHTNHVGLYALGKTYEAEGLKRYVTGKGTLQFRFDEPLPEAEITNLLKKRVAENDAKGRKPAGARPSPSGRSASRAGAAASRRASRS